MARALGALPASPGCCWTHAHAPNSRMAHRGGRHNLGDHGGYGKEDHGGATGMTKKNSYGLAHGTGEREGGEGCSRGARCRRSSSRQPAQRTTARRKRTAAEEGEEGDADEREDDHVLGEDATDTGDEDREPRSPNLSSPTSGNGEPERIWRRGARETLAELGLPRVVALNRCITGRRGPLVSTPRELTRRA